MTFAERVALYRLAAGAQAILEIGSYLGASACCFGAALKNQGRGRILCVDTWANDAMTEGKRDTMTQFAENTAAYHAYISPVRGYSTEVVERVREQVDHLDVLFIDGDHSYEGVKADWDAYKGFLRQGSIVIFHDVGWAEGVQRVIEQDVVPATEKAGHLPNMWWATYIGPPLASKVGVL
jgi:predicted O-methyltransferase YrrM